MSTLKTATCTAVFHREGIGKKSGKPYSLDVGHFICAPDSEGMQEVFSSIIPASFVGRVLPGQQYDVLVDFLTPSGSEKVVRASYFAPID